MSDPLPPRTLTDVYVALCAPFAIEQIQLKPQVVNSEKTRALCAPYADPRVYEDRLDAVVGPDGWSSIYVMTEWGVVCRLSLLGVVKSAIGDYPAKTEPRSSKEPHNDGTIAEAQAFKRACSRFGVGRYLYFLSALWAPYDREKRAIVNPMQVVRTIYHNAGYR
ncbi:MAG: hypothetical protein EI684_02820 [Candidatus Viridilinea halotolerans]|uniref:Uncharacterized protein n=1 Tax=Candidatus Viridilinea halotolerans TaxID=2491704 RepID=A0A426U8S6_9CHLR|nr:MAG: hypothetical protein EI684_02820 [Candidatus Viridilinea halotolerans]